ncbi:CAAX amino terminal protease self-immunity [Roseovarius albus]|uniref:CAAX amino terminal protease self-immunity n=1 Tax=Roseovarius albus TaxID=1247867 RepID=A0A1X6YEZ7_9RHOB|nr:CPBP family intramembrane glutamic endopeptidase [Roseovarius albus]SLN19356.1 CAAX amino terminal protease self-immunity [Roseovarius albus]
MRYAAHHLLTDPALPTASLSRLAGGLVMIVVTFLLLQAFASQAINEILPQDQSARDDLIYGTSPGGALLTLYSFLIIFGALWMTARLVHDRALHTLFGPIRLLWAQFKYALWPLIALSLIILILPSPDGMEPEKNLPTRLWMAYLIPGLLGVLIQTSAEEALFRGYLQSQLAARFNQPLIWLGLPSILFGLVHYDPSLKGSQAWLIVGWASAFGLAAADLTARAGSLGPAIALHFINNVGAILIAAPFGWLDGLALYTYPFSLDDSDAVLAWAPVDILWIFCAWLAIRLTLQR